MKPTMKSLYLLSLLLLAAACAAPLSLLASATVDNGDLLSNGFRWHPLGAPVLLAPGVHVISGYSGITDAYSHALSQPTVGFHPAFTWIDGRYVAAGSVVFPTTSNGAGQGYNESYFGPNLASVPEPGSLVLAGLGMVALGLCRRR